MDSENKNVSTTSNTPIFLNHGNNPIVLDNSADTEPELSRYIRVFSERRWTILSITFATLFLSALYAFTSTPIYRSEAVLEIGRENPSSINNMGDVILQTINGDNETFFTQAGILKSRSMAGALVDKMDLAESPEFDPRPKGFVGVLVYGAYDLIGPLFTASDEPQSEVAKRENLIDAVLERISVKRDTQSRLIRVGMEAKDPKFGALMLSNYIDIYLNRNLDKRRLISKTAGTWLQSELKTSEAKLVKSMTDYVKFTTDHGLVSMDEGSNHVITFFNKAAEGLVRSKEQRVQLEALQNKGGNDVMAIPEGRLEEFKSVKDKLSALEAEYAGSKEIYSEDYPKVLLLNKQIEFLRAKIKEMEKNFLTASVEAARTQERLQQKAFDNAKHEAMANNSLAVQSAILKKEAQTNEEIYKLLLQKSKEMELNTEIIGNNVTVVDPATLPIKPIKPRKAVSMLIGLFVGISGGIMAAFLKDQTDRSIHSAEEVESKLKLPTLGVIPDARKFANFHGDVDHNQVEFLAYEAARSPVSEAVKNIKTSLYMSMPAGSLKTVVVTSSGPREGKTFVSVSLASTLVSGNKRVLLVDADLRRPRVGKIFGMDGAGLTTVLTDSEANIHKVIQKTRIPGLYCMTSGPPPPNPVGLLESDRMEDLTRRLAGIFDVVVFDSPPVIGFSDSRILTRYSDAVILVVKEAAIPLDAVKQAKAMISAQGSKFVGVALNMAKPSNSLYGLRYSKYHSYYGQSENGAKRLFGIGS